MDGSNQGSATGSRENKSGSSEKGKESSEKGEMRQLYFVGREDCLETDYMYDGWVGEREEEAKRGDTKRGSAKEGFLKDALRFKKFYVHSDIEVPKDISKKVFRDILQNRVEFNARYFSGVKKSVDTALDRYETASVFDSASARIRKEEKGLALEVFLKAKPPQELLLRFKSMRDNILLQSGFIKRGLFDRLDTITVGADLSVLDLDFSSASAELFLPFSFYNYGVRYFGRISRQIITQDYPTFGINNIGIGIELEKKYSRIDKGTLGLEYLDRSFDRLREEIDEDIALNGQADRLARHALDDGRIENFRGGRLSYSYSREKTYAKINGNHLKTRLGAKFSFLAGNDCGIESKIRHSVEKRVKGYFTGVPMMLAHGLDIDFYRSFYSRGLQVNNVYDACHRVAFRFRGRGREDRNNGIIGSNVRVRNQFRVDGEGLAGIGADKNLNPFAYFGHSLWINQNRNRDVVEPEVRFGWDVGVGMRWTVTQNVNLNVKLGLESSHGSVVPSVSFDFCSA